MKLIKGKKVKIVDSSKFWRITKEAQSVNDRMCEHCGKIAIITRVNGDACNLNIDKKGFWWKKEYLINYISKKQKDIKKPEKILKPKTRKVWVAMDDNGKVYLSSLKPKLDKNLGIFLANNKDKEYLYVGSDGIIKKLLPNLTYENSPQRINLSIELITK